MPRRPAQPRGNARQVGHIDLLSKNTEEVADTGQAAVIGDDLVHVELLCHLALSGAEGGGGSERIRLSPVIVARSARRWAKALSVHVGRDFSVRSAGVSGPGPTSAAGAIREELGLTAETGKGSSGFSRR